MADAIYDIFTNGNDHPCLTDDEIDALAQRINMEK